MLVTYEKLEEYLEKLKAESIKNKDNPVYINVVRTKNEETNVVSSQIYLQLITENQNVLCFSYDDLPAIKIISPAVFDAILDKDNVKLAKKKYEEDVINADKKITDEYTKIVNVLKDIGFITFVKAIIT